MDKNSLLDTPPESEKKGEFKKVKPINIFNGEEFGATLGIMANFSYGMAESVDNGVSPSFFIEFLTYFVDSGNMG